MKNILLIISLISSLFGLRAQNTEQIKILNSQEFKVGISQQNIQLVDVRTAKEYHVGHIGKAINIDFYRPNEFTEKFEKLDKNKPVYLYCRSGVRSQKAARKLLDMGFAQIYDLRGGYINWR